MTKNDQYSLGESGGIAEKRKEKKGYSVAKLEFASKFARCQRLRSLLTDSPSYPGKIDYTTGVYVTYSFRTVLWVLLRPTRIR